MDFMAPIQPAHFRAPPRNEATQIASNTQAIEIQLAPRQSTNVICDPENIQLNTSIAIAKNSLHLSPSEAVPELQIQGNAKELEQDSDHGGERKIEEMDRNEPLRDSVQAEDLAEDMPANNPEEPHTENHDSPPQSLENLHITGDTGELGNLP